MFLQTFTKRENWWLWIVGVTLCSFTINPKYSSVGIMLLLAHWLFDKNIIKKIKTFQFSSFAIASFLIFAIHIIGILATQYPTDAKHCIETKISFVLLPLLFGTENYCNKKNKNKLFLFFSSICILMFLYSMCYSFSIYSPNWNFVFNRMNVSEAVLHPGYWSNYFMVCLMWSVFIVLQKDTSYNKILHYFFIVLHTIILSILVSKIVLLTLLPFALYIIYKIITKYFTSKKAIWYFLAASILFVLTFSQIPSIQNRIIETRKALVKIDNTVLFSESTQSRMAAWNLEWQLFIQKPLLGHGTGNAYELLQQKMVEGNYTDLAKNHMHTHSQVLHIMIEFGIIGLFVLLFFFISTIWTARKDEFLAWITILFFTNQLTDDMLEIQASVVFFLFVICLLLYSQRKTFYSTNL